VIEVFAAFLLVEGVLNKAILLEQPEFDERISRAACGDVEIGVRFRNARWGKEPALDEVTINGVAAALPEMAQQGTMFERFRVIDGAEIECEKDTHVPHITFKGDGKQDDAWAHAVEACLRNGGVWINDRWERYEVIDRTLRLASTLQPVCASGNPAATKKQN
jgi:hypothetical protein